MTRIVVAGGGTGGHLYPGLAIARALVKARPSIEPFFVGARRGIERDVLPKTEFPHLLLDLHPLYRPAVWRNWRTLAGAAGAWRAVGQLMRRDPATVILGTGGYAAAITLAYGVVHGIPIVQQIGDVQPGLTARFFSRWTREAYLNFPEAARVLTSRHENAFVDTGMPIEPPPTPRLDRRAARVRWAFPPDGGSVLLVYCGSQGSLAINRVVADWVTQGIPSGLSLLWTTGRASYNEFKHLESPTVRVCDYQSPAGDAYAVADLALARAGATTTAELLAWGIPAVLVPLPTAAADHQTTNAIALEQAGAAIHVPQSQLSTQRLDHTVRTLLADPVALARLVAGAAVRARPNAASEIARRILAVVDHVTDVGG
jgi:UDP-N-acetylglucosamine--N-acetylmuramyl-(pentapeptide) pyrophosphoryl-undecaprenol N-acetylglucosamine transferase